MKRIYLTLLLLVSISILLPAQDGVWQWSTEVHNYAKEPKYAHPMAYLWIPQDCQVVNAIIVAQHNMEEISILEDEGFRKQMSKLGVAELWICPRYNLQFDFTDGAWESLDETLSTLADISGYTELTSAKIIGMGHSAAASAPYYLAASNPDRVLACISTSGQWPYFRDKSFAPDIWGDKTIDFIPCLETMGEYEAAQNFAMRGLRDRSERPQLPLSMLACPAEGHFAYSPEKAAYIALFIKKALEYGHVDPTKTGYLKQRWLGDEKPTYKPAPVDKYKGDPMEAFWYFDKEMTIATERYEARFRGKKRQLVGVEQNGKMVPQRNTHMQLHPSFTTLDDGLTLVLKPCFYDTVSGGSPRHKAWTGLEPGTAIRHAKGKPYLEIIAAPAIVSSDTTLTLNWNRMAANEEKEVFIDFCIKHHGDKQYRPAVQQARITIPVRLTEGAEQNITFSPIGNVKTGTKSIKLNATSNCGLKVGYYAECGPVTIKGDTMYFDKMPPRAKFPVKVSVVAWQYGIKGQIKSAESKRQIFYITKLL